MQGSLVYILIFALTVSTQAAFACQDLTLESSFEESDIVFVGTLKAVSKLPETVDGLRPFDALFEVTKVVKGHLPQAITIRDVGNNCVRPYVLPRIEATHPGCEASRVTRVIRAEPHARRVSHGGL